MYEAIEGCFVLKFLNYLHYDSSLRKKIEKSKKSNSSQRNVTYSSKTGKYILCYIYFYYNFLNAKKKKGRRKGPFWVPKTYFLEHKAHLSTAARPSINISHCPHGHSSAGGQNSSTQLTLLRPLK